MSELKPCPFCGSKTRISWDEYRGDYKSPHATVDCLSDDCSASIELDDETIDAAKERVTAAWNTRAAQITPQAGEAEPVKCQHCNGTGEIEPDNNGPIGPCPMCNGKGSYIPRTAPPSPACDGNHAAPACADPECWQRPSPVAPEPTPEGMCRAALLWVLWHHQGGSSDVGQPIRFSLGMGAHEPLSAEQVEAAKSYGALTKKWPPDSPGAEEL